MNGMTSDCSSGCESGWTRYLDHSTLCANPSKRGGGFGYAVGTFGEDFKEKEAKQEDDEEDLSMVSDASSGPPHFHEDEDYSDENGCFCSAYTVAALAKKSNKRLRVEEHRRQQHHHSSFLDDTASSPVLSFSKNNFTLIEDQASMEKILDFSQGLSGTYFKGKFPCQRHFGFLKSALPGKPSSAKQVICREESGNEIWRYLQSLLLLLLLLLRKSWECCRRKAN